MNSMPVLFYDNLPLLMDALYVVDSYFPEDKQDNAQCIRYMSR